MAARKKPLFPNCHCRSDYPATISVKSAILCAIKPSGALFMTQRIVRSVCPYDCPDACGLLVTVENGHAVRVAGDPEHPCSRGTLCAKMNHYEKTVHSPRRLTTPLLRTGRKGSGSFRPVSWDEALDLICARWQEIIASHGAEAILPYSYAGTMGMVQRNAGHPFFHRLGASRLERTICSPAKEAGWQAVMGDTPAVDPDSVLQSDLIILWGINAAATSVHFLHQVAAARRKGAAVWMIDTYQTATSAATDRTLLVRPASDGALALGMMHILARDGLTDSDFISRHVQGFPELAEQVLPDYPPCRVSELTGLAVSELEELAAAYATARAPFIRLGSGLSRYGNGAMTIRTISCLPALVGAYGKTGGCCFCGTSTSAAFAMREITREDFMAQPCRIVNMNRLGEALTSLSAPPVRSLYVYHSNPVAVTPDQNRIIEGLEREDLFTVVHERFMTDTARYADLVLPSTSSLEHPDIYRSYGTYCFQRARAAIPPIGESKSNWEVFSLLAQRLGFTEPFFRQSADNLIELLLEAPSPWRHGIDKESVDDCRAIQLDVPRDPRHPFATVSGRIEILNPRLADPLPRYLPPHSETDPHPFWLMSAPALFGLNSSFLERDDLRRQQGGMTLLINPQDAENKGLCDGETVQVRNELGEVEFLLVITGRVPPSVVVAEGVWWLESAPGKRTVNALTSQRLTDLGNGSTFYDTKVDVRRPPQ